MKWINFIINRIMNRAMYLPKKKRLRFIQRKRYQFFHCWTKKKTSNKNRTLLRAIESTHWMASLNNHYNLFDRICCGTAFDELKICTAIRNSRKFVNCSLGVHAENLLSMANKLEFWTHIFGNSSFEWGFLREKLIKTIHI